MCGMNATALAVPPVDVVGSNDATERRRRRRKNNTATRMEITAIPPATPPAMAPAFELRPATGTGVAVFVVEPAADPVGETEALEAPAIAPGSSSGVPIKVRRGCETVRGEETREKNPTTGGKRFVVVPKVFILERAVSTLSEMEAQQRTVGSRRAQ
jgi:hypothetical protein